MTSYGFRGGNRHRIVWWLCDRFYAKTRRRAQETCGAGACTGRRSCGTVSAMAVVEREVLKIAGRDVAISNPGKVLFPDA